MLDDFKVVVDFWYKMHGKESIRTRLYVWRAFHKVVEFFISHVLKIDDIIRYIETILIY